MIDPKLQDLMLKKAYKDNEIDAIKPHVEFVGKALDLLMTEKVKMTEKVGKLIREAQILDELIEDYKYKIEKKGETQ